MNLRQTVGVFCLLSLTLPLGWAEAACPTRGGNMVSVPAGSFLSGFGRVSTQMDHDFCIDQTEVTARAFNECVAAGGCVGFQKWEACVAPVPGKSPNQCIKGFDEYPANFIDWGRAEAFCRWAGKRLPTGLEWEKAARGTDGRTFPWGNNEDCSRAQYERSYYFNACLGFGGKPNDTIRIGSFSNGASPYGALDMAGNVKEWVEFRADPSVPPAEGVYAESRGGSFAEGAGYVSTFAADRLLGTAVSSAQSGFRCAY